jgi:hypothetical protein
VKHKTRTKSKDKIWLVDEVWWKGAEGSARDDGRCKRIEREEEERRRKRQHSTPPPLLPLSWQQGTHNRNL